jgi:hypothetical protein
MTNIPLELALKTVSTKVTPAAWERAQALKDKTGKRLSDVVSACLLYMPEDKLIEILEQQDKAVAALPRSVRGMMRDADKLSDDEKKMLIDMLSTPQDK